MSEVLVENADLDGAIIEASVSNPNAFGELYSMRSEELTGFFYNRTQDHDLAAELSAETFASAFSSRTTFKRCRGSGRSWLYGVARLELARFRRREAIENRAYRRYQSVVDTHPDDFQRIDELTDVDAVRPALWAAFDELSEADRTAVGARIIDEQPYGEIAERLESSTGAVRVRVYRGLSKLETAIRTTARPESSKGRNRPLRGSRIGFWLTLLVLGNVATLSLLMSGGEGPPEHILPAENPAIQQDPIEPDLPSAPPIEFDDPPVPDLSDLDETQDAAQPSALDMRPPEDPAALDQEGPTTESANAISNQLVDQGDIEQSATDPLVVESTNAIVESSEPALAPLDEAVPLECLELDSRDTTLPKGDYGSAVSWLDGVTVHGFDEAGNPANIRYGLNGMAVYGGRDNKSIDYLPETGASEAIELRFDVPICNIDIRFQRLSTDEYAGLDESVAWSAYDAAGTLLASSVIDARDLQVLVGGPRLRIEGSANIASIRIEAAPYGSGAEPDAGPDNSEFGVMRFETW